MVHAAHWHRLASFTAEDVCRRASAEYDLSTGCYSLPLLDRRVLVDPVRRAIWWAEGGGQPHRVPGYDVALLSVVYLLEAKEMPPSGEWATAESLPAGTFFFRGLHAIPTEKVAHVLGQNREAFVEAGARLGGKWVEGGDACIELQALPRIPVRLVLWLGDEEFASRVTMLFDRLVHQHLPLDALHCLAKHVISSLLQAGQP